MRSRYPLLHHPSRGGSLRHVILLVLHPLDPFAYYDADGNRYLLFTRTQFELVNRRLMMQHLLSAR